MRLEGCPVRVGKGTSGHEGIIGIWCIVFAQCHKDGSNILLLTSCPARSKENRHGIIKSSRAKINILDGGSPMNMENRLCIPWMWNLHHLVMQARDSLKDELLWHHESLGYGAMSG